MARKRTLKTRFVNWYMAKPVLWDVIISIILSIIYIVLKRRGLLKYDVEKDVLTSMMSDFTAASISLAGFVLASLTIIVTFKDNMEKQDVPKKNANEMSGMELLFTGKHYKTIVSTYSWAIVIYILIFIALSIIKFAIAELPKYVAGISLIIGGTMITLTILRAFWVLYIVMQLQINKNTENSPKQN